jgi:DNA-binding beta-propeller fold protein YncE
MPKLNRGVVFAVAVAALLAQGAGSALAEPSPALHEQFVINEPLEFFYPAGGTECNTEDILLSGQAHGVGTVTISPSGNLAIAQSFHTTLSGIGATTGLRYTYVQGESAMLSFSIVEEPFSITGVLTQHLISQGGSVDSLLTAVFHVTIDANGEPRAIVDQLTLECRGAGA